MRTIKAGDWVRVVMTFPGDGLIMGEYRRVHGKFDRVVLAGGEWLHAASKFTLCNWGQFYEARNLSKKSKGI